MHIEYPFNGEKYEKSSQCQREWGTKLAGELHLKGNETILDLGCGNGVITRELANRVPYGAVVGVDSSPSMLEAAKAHKTANMELKLLDIDEMTFEAEFDVVFSNAALHWVLDHEKLLKKIYNALKQNGFLQIQFAGDGNCPTFIAVVRGVMELPEFVTCFEDFR
jgi:trans-aconitate methyltransferase